MASDLGKPTREPDPQARVARRLARQGEACLALGSPLYARLLARAAEEVRAGGPAWDVLAGHDTDPPGSALALRLMGAVHRLVLLGQAPQLARYYPTAGGTTTEDPWPDFEALLVERADDIRALLDRTVQTNEVGRSAALIGGFLVVAARTGLPMRVLEIGASAGLNLRWDHFSYEARGATWGDATSPVRLCDFDAPPAPPFDVETTVIERRGCDRNPLDPTTDAGRLTLLSYVWPDQHPRVRLLTGALEVARRVPAQVDKANVTDWLTVQLSEPRPGVATVVYHSIVMQYLTEEERQGVDEVLAGAGTAATPNAPLARLQMEPAGPEAAIHLTMWPSAETELIAKSGYHGARVRWLAR